ncbi:MAG: hypothetical protein ACRYHQ_29820 [Janthinobacterium lividum]
MTADLWIPAVWAQFRAGNLTPLFRDVLLRLQKFDRGQGLWPAHETLAERAGCCVRTVRDALKQGRALGLVDWVSGASRRTSNRYTLLLPRVAAEAGTRLSRSAARLAARAKAVARALVGRMRREGEQQEASKRPTGQGSGWRAWPEPQAPVRSVAEQLAILASWEQEKAHKVRPAAGTTALR